MITVIILLALASACFGQDKTQPIQIDCTIGTIDFKKLRLRGFSYTKVPPDKIAIMEYSRPEFNPEITYTGDYVVLGKGSDTLLSEPTGASSALS